MSSLPLRRLILLMSSFSLAFIALASIYSLTLARRSAGTIIVNPGDSIQAAIDAATPGDTVLINAGTYTESLTLNKAVSLTGVSSTTVVIHALPYQRVLTVTGAVVNRSEVISGFTLAGGYSFDNGGGVHISNGAQPFLQNLIVFDNMVEFMYSDGYGGGIYSTEPLTLRDIQFINSPYATRRADIPMSALRNGMGMPFLRKVSY